MQFRNISARPIRSLATLAALSMVFTVSCSDNVGAERIAAPEWSDEQWSSWQYLAEELDILELHSQLSTTHRPQEFVIRNVTMIAMSAPGGLAAHSVHVNNGKIAGVGPDAEIEVPGDVLTIDGDGMYVIPGLTDMHVHNLESSSQHLLNIAHGVTTVRDLDGFPFLLKMRDAIAGGDLLAPTMIVSGTILNGSTFGGYALKVDTEAEARSAVQEQAALGYDLIKTHNSLSVEAFDAIADEASLQQLDVVGHIPVDVTVEHAIKAGMRTLEHFKGYIKDDTLTLTEENYLDVMRNVEAEVWNTPTFVNYRNQLRGNDAAALLDNQSEMQYVSPRQRAAWRSYVDEEEDAVTKLRQNIYPLSKEIFANLRTIDGVQFLAGTDSGSYEMMPPGIVLLEELRIFESLGMTPFEAMQTATVNGAEAMRREGEFGVIAAGARADLVLLKQNPLDTTANLQSIEGVAIRGVWMSREDLDAMLDSLKDVYARSGMLGARRSLSTDELDRFLERVRTLDQSGFVFRDHYLDLAASMFVNLDRQSDADELMRMKTDAAFGFDWLKF